jgi:ribosomal protein S18 acetylase RimI-like enzyme
MIAPLTEKDHARFFAYLDKHLTENGKGGTPLFQPMSRSESGYPQEKKANFLHGLSVPIGQAKWRRAWIAFDAEGNITGHVDLRSLPEPHTQHRALLGMGVNSNNRRQGVGRQLLEFAAAWAKGTGMIEVIDLAVLSNNIPAIQLYEKAGFERVCEIADKFRVDGQSVGDLMMTLKL